MSTIYLDNTSTIKLTGLQSSVDNSYVNDATVTATLYESDEVTEVTGETWPITLSYIASSNGNYSGSFSADVNVTEFGTYKAVVTAVATDGSKFTQADTVKVLERKAS